MWKLEDVFTRLKSAGLTLKLSKCKYLQKKVAFLGHVLDEEGVHTTNEKVKAIATVLSYFEKSKLFDHC